MNNLRFRAWCIPTKQYLHYVEIYSYKDGSVGWSAGENNHKPIGNSDNFIIEQYSGEEDIHSKPLFVGDKVRCVVDGITQDQDDTIVFKNGCFWLDRRYTSIHDWLDLTGGYLEIIGNIHESIIYPL